MKYTIGVDHGSKPPVVTEIPEGTPYEDAQRIVRAELKRMRKRLKRLRVAGKLGYFQPIHPLETEYVHAASWAALWYGIRR